MSKYSQVDSAVIRRAIQGLSWTEHEYVDDLIRLRESVVRPPDGWAANVQFHILKERYRQEYLGILREHSPKRYEKEVARLEELEAAILESRKSSQQEEQDLLQDWLAAGGQH